MTTILLSKEQCHMDSFESFFGFPSEHVTDIKRCKPVMIAPYRPYLVCEDQPTPTDRSIMHMLNNPRIAQVVTNTGIHFGPENTLGTAEIMLKMREHAFVSTGLLGEHLSRREEQMLESVKKIREGYMNYGNAANTGAPRHELKIQVTNEVQEFNRKYGDALTSSNKKRMSRLNRSPLKNLKRGLGMARSSRNFALYDFESVLDASLLRWFGKFGRVLGPGAVALDFGMRSAEIGSTAAEGGDFYRKAFTEYLGFVGGVGMGTITATILGVAVNAFLVATPAGWVMLLISAGIAGVAGLAAMRTDEYFKEQSGKWYDAIMEFTAP